MVSHKTIKKIFAETLRKFSKPMVSHKTITKIFAETLRKVLLDEKKGFKKDIPALPSHEIFSSFIISKLSYGFSLSIWS